MALVRPGGTCPVCGVSIDRRAAACRKHRDALFTPDTAKAAAESRWEKEKTVRPLAWIPIESSQGRTTELRAGTSLGVISLAATGTTWDLYLVEDAFHQIGTLSYDKDAQAWHTYLTAPQTFRRGYDEMPYDGDLRGTGFASWMMAVDSLLGQADQVAALYSRRPVDIARRKALLTPTPSVSPIDQLRWEADPEGAQALLDPAARSRPTPTPPSEPHDALPAIYDPSIPAPAMTAADLANLIRRYGAQRVGEATINPAATLAAAVNEGWDLGGWAFRQGNGSALWTPRNHNPKIPWVLWVNASEDDRVQWERIAKEQHTPVIVLMAHPARGYEREEIPF